MTKTYKAIKAEYEQGRRYFPEADMSEPTAFMLAEEKECGCVFFYPAKQWQFSNYVANEKKFRPPFGKIRPNYRIVRSYPDIGDQY